jgi:hypothetical protein
MASSRIEVIRTDGSSNVTYRVHRADGQLASVWYDRYERIWTVHRVNDRDEQIGPAEYDSNKVYALGELAETVELYAHIHWNMDRNERGAIVRLVR